MNLIAPYIESFISQLRYSSSPLECKGIISFDEIKEELGRERVTSQMIEDYKLQVEMRGIEVEVNNERRVIYITVKSGKNLILTPSQMKQMNEAREHFIRTYE